MHTLLVLAAFVASSGASKKSLFGHEWAVVNGARCASKSAYLLRTLKGRSAKECRLVCEKDSYCSAFSLESPVGLKKRQCFFFSKISSCRGNAKVTEDSPEEFSLHYIKKDATTKTKRGLLPASVQLLLSHKLSFTKIGRPLYTEQTTEKSSGELKQKFSSSSKEERKESKEEKKGSNDNEGRLSSKYSSKDKEGRLSSKPGNFRRNRRAALLSAPEADAAVGQRSNLRGSVSRASGESTSGKSTSGGKSTESRPATGSIPSRSRSSSSGKSSRSVSMSTDSKSHSRRSRSTDSKSADSKSTDSSSSSSSSSASGSISRSKDSKSAGSKSGGSSGSSSGSSGSSSGSSSSSSSSASGSVSRSTDSRSTDGRSFGK